MHLFSFLNLFNFILDSCNKTNYLKGQRPMRVENHQRITSENTVQQVNVNFTFVVMTFWFSLKNWPFCWGRCDWPSHALPPSLRSAQTSPSRGHWWTHPYEPCMQTCLSPWALLYWKILKQTLDWEGAWSKAWDILNKLRTFLEFHFHKVLSLLPAPEDRHYIANDLVVSIHC